MGHRLLHTLVVSSSLLLDACGSSAASSEPASSDEPSTGAENGGTASGGTAVATPAGEVAPTGDGTPIVLAACRGWPTTKGAHYEVDAQGVRYYCGDHVADASGVMSPSCCPEPATP